MGIESFIVLRTFFFNKLVLRKYYDHFLSNFWCDSRLLSLGLLCVRFAIVICLQKFKFYFLFLIWNVNIYLNRLGWLKDCLYIKFWLCLTFFCEYKANLCIFGDVIVFKDRFKLLDFTLLSTFVDFCFAWYHLLVFGELWCLNVTISKIFFFRWFFVYNGIFFYKIISFPFMVGYVFGAFIKTKQFKSMFLVMNG